MHVTKETMDVSKPLRIKMRKPKYAIADNDKFYGRLNDITM